MIIIIIIIIIIIFVRKRVSKRVAPQAIAILNNY